MLSISIAIFTWFKVRKIIWSSVTNQKNLHWEVFLLGVKWKLMWFSAY
jgi:hypothetical protein